MTDCEPLKIYEVILNLKLISKIKQNEKMVVINKILRVDQRPFQTIFRWYTADNRLDTLHFIEFVVNSAFSCLDSSDDTVYKDDVIKKELLNILTGLDNLKATYKLDNFIVSKIDILNEKIIRLCS